MPSLVPVEHDPFNGETASLSLVPVDHDPFVGAFGVGSPAEDAQRSTGLADFLSRAAHALVTLPQRAIENSQSALDTGNYNPAPAVEAAMLPMGTGAMAGVPVRVGEAVLGAGPIRAYHGSPHDFDQFDLSKIGTGEGAQAYGHGLYFAENEGVAKSYRDALTQPVQTIGNAHVQNIGGKYHVVDDFGVQAGPFGSKEEALASMNKQQGKMYEVNIHADPEHMLNHDLDLRDHPRAVQNAIKNLQEDVLKKNPNSSFGTAEDIETGGTMAARLEYELGKEHATQALHEAGIPGIKYLDRGSRAAGDGSRNYVVFNDKLIDIVRKYAAAGIALPPAIAAEYQSRFKPVDHDPFAPQQATQ